MRRTVLFISMITLTLVLGACGSEDGTDGTEARDEDTVADEVGSDDTTVDAGSPSTGASALACPAVAEIAAITGIEITSLSGPAAGDPTPLGCQYVADDFSTSTAVYLSIDPVDSGPIGFGTAVDGLGEWAEVDGAEGVLYVGFGDGMLEVGTYAELSDEQLVAIAEAAIAAGSAG